MRGAFTLLELIFVLIIIGVLSAAALYRYRPQYLLEDIDFVRMRLLRAKYQGIQYDKRHSTPDINASVGCVDLQKEAWRQLAIKKHYTFHADIITSYKTLCFDSFGRPHLEDNLTLNAPIAKPTELLLLRYRSQEARLILLPQSGYVLILQHPVNGVDSLP